MRVPMSWLRDFVDLKVTADELADRLSLTGLEVEAVERLDSGLDGVVVGEILEIRNHPDADRLVVCLVETGYLEPLQLVTGAPNVHLGQKVAVALPGSVLPGGMKIKKQKLRGVLSGGMLCSAQELGLDQRLLPPEQREGIIEFPSATIPGEPVARVLGLDDNVLTLAVTPNRADCLSMVNLAREVAAICELDFRPLKYALKEERSTTTETMASVKVEDPGFCWRYVARVVTGLTVAPSPEWMQRRLAAAGIRPINNLVDVTNYVMLEMGQPFHAFDYDRLVDGQIIVRLARPGEEIVTLDGNVRSLDEDMLLICDTRGPVAVAGVMGGYDTEVTGKTTTVLLESACFNPASIRRTARKLGMRSESSSRFERGVNIMECDAAADRAAALLAELGGGKVVPGRLDVYQKLPDKKSIELRVKRINDLLGTGLSQGEVLDILNRLGLEPVIKENGIFLVGIPPYRMDLNQEIDLVEEVARLYGYDMIPATMPVGKPATFFPEPLKVLCDHTADLLARCGLNEVITYSFHNPALLARMLLPGNNPDKKGIVKIKNPINDEQGVLRTTLLSNLLVTAARNYQRRNIDLGLFEVGRVFLGEQDAGMKRPEERTHAAALAMGKREGGWNWPARDMDFFYLKGILGELLETVGAAQFRLRPVSTYPFLHPGRAAEVVAGENVLGFLGELHPQVTEAFSLPSGVIVFEIDMQNLLPLTGKERRYREVTKYPAVSRDLAVIVPETIQAEQVGDIIRVAGAPILSSLGLFDLYRGTQVPQGYKSLAFSLVYQVEDRTLTDEEVKERHQAIKDELAVHLGAAMREV